MASRKANSIGIEEVFAFNEKLLFGPNGERCFEEVFADAWFARNKPELAQPPWSKSVELCYENMMALAYARKLMQQNQETYLENAWGDPHISAEVYIQLKALQIEKTPPQTSPTLDLNTSDSPIDEFVYVRRRRKNILDSPLTDEENDADGNCGGDDEVPVNENDQAPPPVIWNGPDLTTVQEVEEGEKEDSPLRLRRTGGPLIDVSNCCLPSEDSPVSSQDCATQLFSPGQVRQLLLGMQRTMNPVKEEGKDEGGGTMEAVDPWCPRFTEVFWSKVALRTSAISSYYAIRTSTKPRKIFSFGRHSYSMEGQLSRGRFGVVYLARLLASTTEEGDNALSLDTTTVGCVPELLQQKQKGGILRVVKVETPGFPLEFYYMHEARRRVAAAYLAAKLPVDVRPSICPALGLAHSQGHFTCLLMPFYAVGLLDWLNYTSQSPSEPSKRLHEGVNEPQGGSRTKRLRLKFPPPIDPPPALSRLEEEVLAVYLTLELLWLLEGLHHHARIIHGDIKPDNFRLNGHFPLLEEEEEESEEEEEGSRRDFMGSLVSGRCTRVLVLVDFGLCVDMARFPPDTCLRVDEKRTSKRPFPCIEMRTGRPWTYQLDLFNVAGVIYTLIFKRYMEVEFANGSWIPKSLPRTDRNYRAMAVWREVFGALLNVRSCAAEDYPDLGRLRTLCEAFLRSHTSAYNMAAERANSILTHLTRLQRQQQT